MNETARTWAEIDLSALRQNYHTLRGLLRPETKFLGVVKADAYGHGAVHIAKTLEEEGCDWLGVATLPEAQELRASGISLPILILGRTAPEYTRELLSLGVTQAVSSLEDAVRHSAAAEEAGGVLPVHLKLETGMGRTGIDCREGRTPNEVFRNFAALSGLDIQGVFTHFSVAEDDAAYTRGQFDRFLRACDALEAVLGHPVAMKHCANSAATLQYPEMQLDMVRPGIVLYGALPDRQLSDPGLVPVMTLKSRIAQLHSLRPGDCVSYGRRFCAEENMTAAVLPIGYADGLHRILSGKAVFSLNENPVRQIGSICMDMCMADVTDVPDVAIGSEMVIFGKQTRLPLLPKLQVQFLTNFSAQ